MNGNKTEKSIIKNKILRNLLIAAGFISIGIGVIGIFVPLLPATDFFLLAALCFGASSPKFYNWLLYDKLLGKYIRNYKEGRGMTFGSKLWTLIFLWCSIGYSVYAVNNLFVRILLIVIAASVTIHLFYIKTANNK
jgi:uncharacterized membrane protein YbaN (DUF454 family)